MNKITLNKVAEIKKYMNLGLSLEVAAKKVKANHLNRLDNHVEAAVKIIQSEA